MNVYNRSQVLCSPMHAVGVQHQTGCVLLMALHADCGRLKRDKGMQGPRPAYFLRDDCIITTSLAMHQGIGMLP